MAQKIKFKVISFSSQEKDYACSSLVVPGSDGWQTKRFCNYPQEVTLEFYGVVHLDKIQILADTRKIASSVDVLYYDPTQGTQSRFAKYGSLQFSRNQSGRIHQQKTVMVDLKCLYLRFLFHRPFKNKQNFFSQVHIHQIVIYGGQSNVMLPLDPLVNKKNVIKANQINEQQDQFVYQKLIQLQNLKRRAAGEQNFDEAQRLKQIMVNVKKFGYYIKGLKQKKDEAKQNQDYEEAKNIKQQIDRVRRQVQQLINTGVQGQQEQMNQHPPELQDDVQDNQFVGLEMKQMFQNNSRVSHKNSRIKDNNSSVKNNKFQNSYDERIIPAHQNKFKTQESQNQPQELQLPEPEEIDGNNSADAQMLLQFFDEEIVKKFYSKTWQWKEKGLSDIITQSKTKAQDTGLIKALLRATSHSIIQTNFKISLLSINLLTQTLKINSSAHKVTRTNTDILRDLQIIIDEIIKKNSDNNSKIKNTSELAFQDMIDSNLFGIDVCSTNLMKHKSKTKLSSKQQAQRLNSLANLVSKYGLGDNGVPHTVIEYAVQKLSNPAGDVRNQSISLLATCANLDQKEVVNQLQGKKPIFLQQVQARQKQLVEGGGGANSKKNPIKKKK